MNHPKLPSTVMHDLINVNLICNDQLKVSYILKDYLCINEQIFATILRSSCNLNLKNLFNDCIKDSIQYVQEEHRIIVKNSTISWPYILPQSFDLRTLNKVWAYYATDLFALYTRLFSYSPFVYRPKHTLIDIFELPFVFRPASLSFHELNFYKIYGNDLPTPPKIVRTFQEFKDNLINRFSFDKISSFIDFNQFILAGGSVLMSLLQNAASCIASDLDLFYIGEGFRNFIDIFEKTHRNLRNFHFVKQRVLSYRRVYELEITLGSSILEIINESKIRKKLTIQFIYHPCVTSIETYLMAFDLDIIQICFNGEKVLSTWACIRALNTGTFICYNLTNDLVTLVRSAVRIGKYYQRNFKLL
ncbi:unnamed protein product, partial [Rotaria socialis]